MMERDRMWIEINDLASACRIQIDANCIVGQAEEARKRHSPILDRSGELWLPGTPKYSQNAMAVGRSKNNYA